ncbi:MAG: hypothetical protein DMF60_16900 [Acidobacteria bacterium]|nr:MAG: hypothetical protein DMF60_16900 [Acidobacteriota bacterium]
MICSSDYERETGSTSQLERIDDPCGRLRSMKADPVKLEIFKSLYSSVAEEMGVSLRRSAFSPNIKERRDYSCAVFNRDGTLIAQGDHMPVHLGSMPMSVRAALETVKLGSGDIVVLNDPYAGGTHLPDVTMVAAVYGERRQKAEGRRQASKSERLPSAFHLLTNPCSTSRTERTTPTSEALRRDRWGERRRSIKKA